MRRSLIALAILASSSSAFGAITNFELPWYNSTAGAIYKSADHPNTVYVMEAFQNFCPACNENASNVDQMATSYAGNAKVQVLDLTLDSADREIRSWIANHHPNHPVVKDVGHKIWAEIDDQYIPTAVVVDCNGEIAFKVTGTWDSSTKAAIKRAVDDSLAACSN